MPSFGFILFGGFLSGALVRDIRLANELAARGHRVHVWWIMDRLTSVTLHESIEQHWLFHGLRYSPRPLTRWMGRSLRDRIGQFGSSLFRDRARQHYLQKRPHLLDAVMHGLVRHLCLGVEHDPRQLQRFARELRAADLDVLCPMLALMSPFCQAVAHYAGLSNKLRYLVTFQGYELYVRYAAALGLQDQLLARFRSAVEHSHFPAVAVSEDYRARVHEDIGVPLERMVAIPPGVPMPQRRVDRVQALKYLVQHMSIDPAIPLVSYVGRRDAEKGLDLLLYAARIMAQRGIKFQVAICGPTLWGNRYVQVCQEIADNMRLPVIWSRDVSDEHREHLFAASRAVIYPSIHREPFGMVPVEAMAQGTPVLVPDLGGVSAVVEADGRRAGLRFQVWDSGDLADQLQRLLTDDALWRELSDAAPAVAAHFSVQRLAERFLDHVQ
jgi:glycosyltransferase involved in cell wall biosynthesis